ncbi:hypothetical protein [Legionella quateirensis]|uniref:Vir region protein n=1 Tax=Legionella quateirensis TaxID=45072 RepID=A0A378KR95_9GAMM|nr:hypothetical protein [Legionella quateirensis]KTD47786.1 hypothetical protein Lqua_2179 [Legionella quateirensis]STY16679.1 vir region protein [Legionella quateirensis]
MSRASCISHPEGERLILIRKWQLEACEQDDCAAALLNLFEYWHNIKLEHNSQAKNYNDVAQRHGDSGTQIETLLQWHTTEQLEASLLNIFNKRRIHSAIESLVSLKFISVHRNPNPRYAFDKTKHFLFNPNEISRWLKEYYLKKTSFQSKPKDENQNVVDEESISDLSMVQNDLIDSDDLHQSIGANRTNDDYKNDQRLVQSDSTVTTNCTKQYTKNTYQDYLPRLPTQKHIILANDEKNSSFAFEVFWDKWVALTNKHINKRKSHGIFSNLVMSTEDPLLSNILEALEKQMQEKALRQKLNLFVPQWPNPSSWLLEARWEDEVHLDAEFYKAEILRTNSGLTQNKQTIKQQREYYLDGQYKSRITGSQDEKSSSIANRQDAIRRFDEEFRNRARNT